MNQFNKRLYGLQFNSVFTRLLRNHALPMTQHIPLRSLRQKTTLFITVALSKLDLDRNCWKCWIHQTSFNWLSRLRPHANGRTPGSEFRVDIFSFLLSVSFFSTVRFWRLFSKSKQKPQIFYMVWKLILL